MTTVDIEQTLAPGAAPNREDVLQRVLSSDQLPSLPAVASRLLQLTAGETAELSEVAEVISGDIALSGKLLKVANSAFYSFPQQVGTISQAVSLLGTNAVQSLVLSFSFMSMNRVAAGSRFDFDRFIARSLSAASMARLIQEKVSADGAEEVFVAALLQNLGELILACTMPGEYDRVLEAVEVGPADQRAAEIARFGADHCDVGYAAAQHWNLPSRITLPILHHHDPRAFAGDDACAARYIRIIYLANLLVSVLYDEHPERYHKQFREEAAALLGLGLEGIHAILECAHAEVASAAENFGLQMESARPVQEILQEANIRLSLLNLDYDQINKQLIRAKLDLERLTRELQEKNEVLKQMADLDWLTGAFNSRYFQGALDRELSRTIRCGYWMTVVLTDIDHFKRFNDNHGHLVGDFVLQEFTRALTDNLRRYDTLARYGGEEFVIILPQTNREEGLIVAEKLRDVVEQARFVDSGEVYTLTASFGVASICGSDEAVPCNREIIRMVDVALYDAKERGRNRVAAYSERKGWFRRK